MYDEAARDRALRRVFNITLSEYKMILAAQGGRCFICLKALDGFSNPVDHDHVSGQVRGILCTEDNRYTVGSLTDWQVAQRVADYLRHPPAQRVLGKRFVPKFSPKRKRATRPASSKR